MPPPDDERWTAPAINLLRAAVLLDLSYDAARIWAAGATKTAMGATVMVSTPLVPAVRTTGRHVDLPLMGVAGIVLLKALEDAGADAEALGKVMLSLQDEHGVTPLAASREVALILPAALAAAATDRAEPSLLSPIVPLRDGWRFGDVVGEALGTFDHDDHGWVTGVRLVGGAVVVRSGRTTVPPVTAADAVLAAKAMFRAGRSLVAIATALDCEVDDVEAALRLQV